MTGLISMVNGDALHIPLGDGVVQTVITSPPYWGLRDYGVSGQLGLEPTPEAYIARMVAVFREVWRVMRPDGTLWLNIGDCYSSAPASNGISFRRDRAPVTPVKSKRIERGNGRYGGGNAKVATLKSKDLVMMPARLALALQQPFYAGKIKNEYDRIWLAAMIDTEGCMFIHKRKVGQNNGQGYSRKHDSYGAGLEVANTHISIVERCKKITGMGSITAQDKENRFKNRNLTLYRWHLRSNICREVIREVYPYLVAKKHEARLLLGCPSSGEKAERAHVGLIALHNGKESDIDFPEPKPMYEPGFYLRSDIIWAKLNPMPESVGDRPTKSYEHVFLLTKSASYYYDQEAIREPQDPASLERLKRGWNGDGMRDYPKGPQNHIKDYMGKTDEEISALSGRNRRDVWIIATESFSGAHFATFPQKLVEPMILAGSSPQACETCSAPWERIIRKEFIKSGPDREHISGGTQPGANGWVGVPRGNTEATTLGWRPTCACPPERNTGAGRCIILDPFAGTGTVGKVAVKHGRRFVGLELKPEYIELARARTDHTQMAMPV